MYDDDKDDCPCDTCDVSCDSWDAQFCCTLCRWGLGEDIEPDCENCDPWDI
jgi:hypothetical protein